MEVFEARYLGTGISRLSGIAHFLYSFFFIKNLVKGLALKVLYIFDHFRFKSFLAVSYFLYLFLQASQISPIFLFGMKFLRISTAEFLRVEAM